MQEIKCGTAFPLGVGQTMDGVQFALHQRGAQKVSLLLYENRKVNKAVEYPLENYRMGDVYTICFTGKRLADFKDCAYVFQADGEIVCDPYAQRIYGKEYWGKGVKETILCGVYEDAFDWEDDRRPELNYSDLYLYQLHVRGFTKHPSSGVEGKGCFQGIEEKIPYLKELGVNGIFLLPCYEFDEIIKDPSSEEIKLNYWGYARSAFYFTPKSSYAKDRKSPQNEMKRLIKALHQNQMEVIMDMYFPEGTNPFLIMECLRFWALTYHVDGFRINDNVAPSALIATDPVAGSVKLFAQNWDALLSSSDSAVSGKRRLAEFNESFLTVARRFLKSDEGQVGNFMRQLRRNPPNRACINYLTSVNGFTLMDLVSYDIKHNEANGEQGKDGTDFNYSWNCGTEGNTRKKQILSLRRKQIRNAFLMLFLSQGTPMLLAGDEFGNSQMGNNNAYCQDNKVTWLNWKDLTVNHDIYLFVRQVIALRKGHPILHPEEELKGMDYISSGIPDISFHGERSWYVDDSNYSRLLGVMLNGEYRKIDKMNRDDAFYLAFNMHWENHSFDIPKLPKGKKWILEMDSFDENEKKELTDQRAYLMRPRSIAVLRSVTEANEKKEKKER